MSYIKNNLITDEYILYFEKANFFSEWRLLGVAAFLCFGTGGAHYAVLAGCALFALAVFFYATTEAAITNKRVVYKASSLIFRGSVEVKVENIESILVEQSILGRIFNYGDVVVSGLGIPQLELIGLNSPLKFRKKFYEIQQDLMQSA